MRFDDYSAQAGGLARGHDENDPFPCYAALGLCGEAGEFADLVKKARRGDGPLDTALAVLELGDALWYISRAAHKLGVPLSLIAAANLAKLRHRKAHGKNPAAENEIVRSMLAALPKPPAKEPPRCAQCFDDPAGLDGFCSILCRVRYHAEGVPT